MTYLHEAAVRAALAAADTRVLTVQLLPGEAAWAGTDGDLIGPLVVQFIRYRDGDVDFHVLPALTVEQALR